MVTHLKQRTAKSVCNNKLTDVGIFIINYTFHYHLIIVKHHRTEKNCINDSYTFVMLLRGASVCFINAVTGVFYYHSKISSLMKTIEPYTICNNNLSLCLSLENLKGFHILICLVHPSSFFSVKPTARRFRLSGNITEQI